jgi:hypothetical protein
MTTNSSDVLAEALTLMPEGALPEGITIEAAENMPHPPDSELTCVIMGEDIV